MPSGPFQPGIMPVIANIHYNDVLGVWVVRVSRQVTIGAGPGAKREISRQSFYDYLAALSFISVFWGNS